jgi:hypothetical protein
MKESLPCPERRAPVLGTLLSPSLSRGPTESSPAGHSAHHEALLYHPSHSPSSGCRGRTYSRVGTGTQGPIQTGCLPCSDPILGSEVQILPKKIMPTIAPVHEEQAYDGKMHNWVRFCSIIVDECFSSCYSMYNGLNARS